VKPAPVESTGEEQVLDPNWSAKELRANSKPAEHI
jgi:hypothetical protein